MRRTPLLEAARDQESVQQSVPRLGRRRPPFVMVPLALLNDERLGALDVCIWCNLRAVDRDNDNVARISLKRIGERVRRGERAIERHIRKLEKAGWLQRINNGIGRCLSYRLLTPANNGGASEKRTPVITDRGTTRTPAIYDSEPLPSVPRTTVMGDQLPRRPLNYFPNSTQQIKTTTRDDARHRLLRLLAECQLDRVTAEREADRLLSWFPNLYNSLIGHLKYAANTKLEDPVQYVIHQTQRGETPKPVPDDHA
jgi:hypothetical protein